MQIKIFIANLLESNPETTPPDVSFGANRPLKESFQDVTRRRNPPHPLRASIVVGVRGRKDDSSAAELGITNYLGFTLERDL
ncbi:hypothetical protein CDAR_448261 [Caerostris darwini]|uniref:Uncharacterized protein n=1 Tax=Caerostris darwini TaxID=1538125 RepID=A0AAV4SH28_9ARAC|nr:hypothetical protein CDAR_448261 [Caerostris darwini]